MIILSSYLIHHYKVGYFHVSQKSLNVLFTRKCENEKMLHPQQFGFQKDISTEHALAQLLGQVYESFESDLTTLVFLSTCQRRLIKSMIQYF